MIIFDFQNAVAESIEDVFPELLTGPNDGAVIAKSHDNVSFRPPAVIIRFDYSNMVPDPGRVAQETVDKNTHDQVDSTPVGERTTWHPYEFPFSVGIRTDKVTKMHEWWERLFSEWGKHFVLDGVPVDHQGFGEPEQTGLHAITLNYNTWVNLKGNVDKQYLVEQHESEVVHNNDIELVKVSDDEISDSS